MGQKNSKDELVYQQVLEGNFESIKALCREGALLEWVDEKGKTPLIVACMDIRLYHVAKTLIELGANVNAFRPGRHAGTPLHHAAKRGLDNTVKLLFSMGANPFVRNDDCQTALDIARAKGFNNVVRAIEAYICYFSGEICEARTAPGILEPLVPQRLSRKRSKTSWVVVVPCSLPNSRRPVKLELAVYSSPQDPQPRTVIALWNSKIVEPKLPDSDPAMIIFDESTKTRYKFLSAIEGDRQQLSQLYNACKGVTQVMPSPHLDGTETPPSSTKANAEDAELAMALNASIHATAGILSAVSEASYSGWANAQSSCAPNTDCGGPGGWGPAGRLPPPSKARYSGWADEPPEEDCNGWAQAESRPTYIPEKVPVPVSVLQSANPSPPPVSAPPSAPPIPDDVVDSGPIHYPDIDMGPVDFPVPAVHAEACISSEAIKPKTDECCVICWEAPIEGACIPCGHMAGCMSCLMEIKAEKGVCPVCRTKMDQVIKLYAV